MTMFTAYGLLGLAIALEVIATSALKASDGFTRLGPSVIVVAGYGFAFLVLGWTLKVLPVGLVYAIWAGLGIVGVALIDTYWFGSAMTLPKMIGIAFIVSGVTLVKLSSV